MSIKRCGYVALIGAPNAGKSTLMNALVGEHLSIVTPKAQTTRGRIRAIAQKDHTQIIFIDTPGIFAAKPAFERAMVESAWSGAEESDLTLLVVDAERGLDDQARLVVEALAKRKGRMILALNKIDKVEKTRLPEMAKALYDLIDFERSFMISATKGSGVDDMLRYFADHLPEGEFLYPEDQTTDRSERDIAAEFTREQCFMKLHAELPYGLKVETETWEESSKAGKRQIKLRQQIIVERESHKKIILGKGGAMLKSIGSVARRRIGETLGADVHLFLFVKVQESWKNDPHSFTQAGLEFKQ